MLSPSCLKIVRGQSSSFVFLSNLIFLGKWVMKRRKRSWWSWQNYDWVLPVFPWRRKWQPTPVYLPGISHGWRSRAGYSPWGRKESDTTEQLHSLTRLCSEYITYFCSPDGLRGGSLSKKNFKDIRQRFLTLRQEETLIRKNWCKADELQGKWCLTLKA